MKKEHFPQDYQKETEFGKPICMHSFVFLNLLVFLVTCKFTFVKTKKLSKNTFFKMQAGSACAVDRFAF